MTITQRSAHPSGPALFNLSGRVALITGGNGGIGLSIAQGLGQAGAKVAIVGRNAQKGEAAVAQLADAGVESCFFASDVSDEVQVQSLFRESLGVFGRLDILVNNAGVTTRRRPEDLPLDDWMRILNGNLTSAFLCSKAAYPAFKEQGGGKVINIGSMYSLFGSELGAAYAASKGGILQLTKVLAAAWGSDNIQANAILPGWIKTDMGSLVENDPGDRAGRILARTAAGRWGRIEDLRGISVFLASNASDFVTGAGIPVDGGYSALG